MWLLLALGCGEPAPEPVQEPKPVATKLQQVAPPTLPVDVEGAAPRRVVEVEPSGDAPAPAATLLFSSRGDGEIERCGCPKNPAGGLARRRTLIDGLREEGPLFVFDAGDSLGKLEATPNSRTHAKVELIADEWKRAGIDAVALGAGDWKQGTDFLMRAVEELPVVAANLVCGTERPFPAARVVEQGGRRFGVVGLTLGEVEGCTVTDPRSAALAARELLPEGLDGTVLLWPDRDEAAHTAGLAGLPYDFVVDASGRFGKDGAPFWAGTTWLVGAGTMTKAHAQIDVRFTPGGTGFFPATFAADLARDRERLEEKKAALESRFDPGDAAYQSQAAALRSREQMLDNRQSAYGAGKVHTLALTTVRLTDDVEDDAAVAERVTAVKDTFGQGADAAPSEILARKLVGPAGSSYAGAQACGTCHAEQWTQWTQTKHARAFQTLIRTKNHHDDSCYGCHVTGADAGGEPAWDVVVTTPETIGGMLQVQCEACHGPSAAHVADPAVKPVREPDVSVCQGCHDGKRDEGAFEDATYRPKVAH